MKKTELRESEDGKCPYCQSDFVLKTGESVSGFASSSKSDQSKETVWKCYRCNKEFFCVLDD